MKNMKNLVMRGISLLMATAVCIGVTAFTALAEDDVETHEHNPVTCETCKGEGTIVETNICPDCNGEVPEDEKISCTECDGTGSIYIGFDWNNPPCPNNGYACNGCDACFFGYSLYDTCSVCNGTGTIIESADECETCGGIGEANETVACSDCEGEGVVACTGEFVGVETTDTSTIYKCAICGASYEEANVDAPKYESAKILLSGTKMGRWYQYEGSLYTATEDVNMGNTLDVFEGMEMSFESLASINGVFSSMNHTNSQGVKITAFAEYVPNDASSKTWQCVGFVPIQYYGAFSQAQLARYVFSENDYTPASGTTIQNGGLDTARAYVIDNSGVLYGDVADESFVRAVESNIHWSGYTQIVTVWYVANEKTAVSTDAVRDIDSVDTVAEVDSSDGVTITASNFGKDTSTGAYMADLTVTIDADAPDTVHVNLSDALKDAFAGIMEQAHDIQPMDTMIYSINIDDQSGRSYQYAKDTGYVATPIFSDGSSTTTAFDGNTISSYTLSVHSSVPRRMSGSAPLADLGITGSATDEAVGTALRGLGYGDDTMSDEEITHAYLGRYYLDWTNANRGSSSAAATSFQDLSITELSAFTDGTTGTAMEETCPDVLKALYYFYYKHIYTFNGTGLYDYMANEATIDDELATAYSDGTTFVLTTAISGEYAGNGFQMTKVGFRMGFDLNATVEPTPELEPELEPELTPEPEPDPEPTPEPTPEPEPAPDPEPTPEIGLEPVDIEIPVTKIIEGRTSTTEEFTFVLTGEDITRSATVVGANTSSFGKIEYTEAGEHTYMVTETTGDARYWTYDKSVWTVTVTVTEDEDTNTLIAAITALTKDGNTDEVYERIEFTNTYNRPSNPSGGDDSSPTPKPDPEPETPEEDMPIVDIPEDDIPLSDTPDDVPVVDAPDEDVPLADIPETDVPLAEIPEEDVPLTDIPEEDVPLVDVPVVDTPEEDVPVVDVPDENVPLVEIPEEDVPLIDVPKTGDSSYFWAMVMCASGIAIIMQERHNRHSAT